MLWIEITAGLVVFLTIWGWIPRDEWWVRGCDFPRLQIIAVGLIVLLLLAGWPAPWDGWRIGLLLLLVMALAYQLRMVLPYTRIWRRQVLDAVNPAPEASISILVSNVLTPNRKYHLLIDLIREKQPDVVLTLETDSHWQQALQVIEPDYPYRVPVPLDNLYGMHLYSRLPLLEPEVKFLLSPEIPSIHTRLRLRNGKVIRLYCLHPKPPSPTEAPDSTLRDAELLMVGRHIENTSDTTIVCGDLNDVAWSRTTRLFQRISGLLDPRVGRKFINTFHANYPPLRWALDHVFHTNDFSLISADRMPHVGSDHFPVMTRLHFDPAMEQFQHELEADAADEQEASDKIAEGRQQAHEEEPAHQQQAPGK